MKMQCLRCLAAAAVVVGMSISLVAHMKFAKSAPAANSTVTTVPASIQVWFTEAPDLTVSKLELRGSSAPIKITGLHIMDKSLMASVGDPMTDGVYTVTWQAAGDDGHVQKGEFKFTLKTK